MLLNQAIQNYLTHLTNLERSSETIRGYRMVLNYLEEYFTRKLNGPVYLEDITFNDLDCFIGTMSREKNWQINSVKKCHYTLSSFFAYCYRKELCPKDISKNMEPIRGEQKERKYLTPEEFKALEEAIEHPLVKLIALTMFYSGMRITECLNLLVGDVDLKRGVFKVREAKGKTFRIVPMHKRLKELFQEHLEGRDDQMPETSQKKFFATKKSGKVSAAYVNQILREAVAKVGLPDGITAHTLRHSFASNLVNKNRSLVHVQKLLGHADLRTTSIYTHAKLDDLAESVNTL